jgi:DNA polymerase III alpha subunit
MKQNNFSELIFTESDVCDLIMKGHTATELSNMTVDSTVQLEYLSELLETVPNWHHENHSVHTPAEFHSQQQRNWHMPTEYQDLDVAKHVLGLCKNEIELQRCGHELLIYQDRGLFDLLKYMVYLVDIMRKNNIVWGLGRGSSVASYVLYKLGVHQVDSIYYNLDVEEFLR